VANYRKYFVAGIKKSFPSRVGAIITKVDVHYKANSADTSFAASSDTQLISDLIFLLIF
jgi:hypothetical protein